MDWDAFTELVKLTVTRLKQGRGDATKVRAAIRHYISRGRAFGMSPMILTDYFAISHPAIPGRRPTRTTKSRVRLPSLKT